MYPVQSGSVSYIEAAPTVPAYVTTMPDALSVE